MWIILLLLWLIFGSLGSVILTRFADGVTRTKLRGFFFWFSQCPHCEHRLWASDLVPLLSYLFHGGKCRYCGAKISWIYSVLEILSAWVFLWTYIWMGEFGRGIILFRTITSRLLLLLLIYDILKYELHMTTRTLLLVTWALWNILIYNNNLWNAVFSSILFIWVFLCIYFFAKRYVKIRFKENKEGFGEGDVYLAFIVWIYAPIIFSFQNIVFSWSMIAKFLIIFILMSSIIWLLRSWLQYIWNLKFTIWNLKFGNKSTSLKNSELWIIHSAFKVIPFFPSMIIAFWLLAWKSHFFITLLFG